MNRTTIVAVNNIGVALLTAGPTPFCRPPVTVVSVRRSGSGDGQYQFLATECAHAEHGEP
jgi:hypothetical protein